MLHGSCTRSKNGEPCRRGGRENNVHAENQSATDRIVATAGGCRAFVRSRGTAHNAGCDGSPTRAGEESVCGGREGGEAGGISVSLKLRVLPRIGRKRRRARPG